ncbi:cytochrome P450 83B1 [Cajanus cajan]|uniref:Cytochrome P450 83B1 n=1 Tax=Cajanus cajan TaxID=3821 RepID=A0A151RVA6_CAJCA|nr:cytochrome P450 83B1 [Cajanus cajan]KYP46473.1 Cytochrome P450 83B1 [Cajanus cajan]
MSTILILCLTLPLLLLFFFQYLRAFKNPSLPPGPRGLPIIGNLHQLNNSSVFHLLLWQLSKKYGPLFSLQLGLRPAIVISSPKLAKEIMKNHDPEFCGRPKLFGQQKLSYNGLEMIFSPYSDFWREIKKLCVFHVLSPRRVSGFSSIRHYEVKQMMKKISMHASSSKVINLNEVLMSLASTMICRIAYGRSYEDEGSERSRFHGLLNECQAMWGTLFFSDYIPFLGWIDKLRGLHARLERIFKELDTFYQEVIDEHMNPNRKTPEHEDIIDVLFQMKKQHSFSVDITNDHIKAIIMDMLVAGTDATAATEVGAMTALVKNPRVMKKVQEEIRSLGGKKDFLDEDDIQNFPYFKAVIKETLRLHLPAPLLVQRETNEACTIDGYEIPAKTLVYVNAWAIHRDPEVWKDPHEFLPERFLDSTIDFRGLDFELIPFGAGRRMCPGMPMGIASLDLILANLLNSFDWELPEGMKREDIDTEVLPGLAQHKKNPLCILAKCRI